MKLARIPRIATACLAATVLSIAGASSARAASFTNSQPVKISDFERTDPYPSTIGVSGLGAPATKVTLTIDLAHSYKSDLEMLLVGPQGQKVLVMSDAAGDSAAPVTWTFDDAAATSLRCNNSDPEPPSGAYRPTNCERFPGDSDALYAPAPPPPYDSALAAFNGTNPNGTWKLYVADVGSENDGTLNSWKLSIEAPGSAIDAPAPAPGSGFPSAPAACPAGNSAGVKCRRAGSALLITGTAGRDTIVGTSGRDIVRCGGGPDTVNTGAGNDDIRCGSGNDRIDAGRGADVLDGGSGNDRLAGGSGNDRLAGGSGNDRLSGGSGRDKLSGGSGRARLSGGSGRDRLSGGSGRDKLSGGTGRDKVRP
jgi:Ca2+-binding RTX toxin-like protein